MAAHPPARLAALAPPGILRIAVAQHPLQMKVDEICRTKMADLNARDIEHARNIVLGTARSMGLELEK